MGNAIGVFRSAVAVALGLCCMAAAQAGPFSALYAFGDSLSDVGNDYIITGGAVPTAAHYTDGSNVGRFTDGLNYLDLMAGSLGVSLGPSVAGGTDYAFGGARTSYVVAGLPPTALSFNQQIASFDLAHTTADPNALYVLWIGANDMSDAISAYLGGNPGAIGNAITNAMSGIGAAVSDLSGRGAEHFLVLNLPDLALVPAISGVGNPALDALAQFASQQFNLALANTLATSAFSSLAISQLDVYGLLNDVVDNPGSYGLTNVMDSCYTGNVDGSSIGGAPVTTCADPSQYAFWDFEHPTAAVHAILAQQAVAAVPEPSTWSLLLVAVGLIAFVRWPRTSN